MRKLKIGIVFLIGMTLSSLVSAQTYTMTQSGDTVVNTATKACSLKIARPQKRITVAAQIVKVSGTVAGTLTMQGSVDGVNFFTVDSASYITDGNINSPATYTATNVALQQKVWIFDGAPYLWYKLSYTGSGTMSAILNGYILPRDN